MSLSDYLAIVGIILSAVGIPVAYFLARRTRQRPDLKYAIDYDVLIDPEDGLLNEGLSLVFGNHQIARVSRTYVAMWNDRGDSIEGTSIVSSDPLRIQLGPEDIALQARIVFRSRPQIKFTYSLNEQQSDRIPVSFDFLDEGDGVILEILHQGESKPGVQGTIRGATIRRASQDPQLSPTKLSWMRVEKRTTRLKNRLFGPDATGRRIALTLLIPIVFFALTVAGLWLVLFEPWRTPRLVDSARYPLQTLEGQADFARKVQQEGIPPARQTSLVIPGVFVGLTLLAFIIPFSFSGRRVIPPSIVSEEVTRQEGAPQVITQTTPETDNGASRASPKQEERSDPTDDTEIGRKASIDETS